MFAAVFLSVAIFDFQYAMPLHAAEPALPSFPPLNFKLAVPEQVTLENGLTVFLLEDHDLPLIQVQMIFKAGSQYDPADKLGLSSLMAQTWTQGGTTTRSSEDIERLLARTAAAISFSMDLESGGAAMTSRTRDFDSVFAVFTDLLRNPAFRADKLRLAKSQSLEGLLRMNDDPGELSRREFRRLIYGDSHPYARIPSPKTLDNIKREDLLGHHRRIVHPNGFFMAVSGDFAAVEIKKKIQTAFRDWPRGEIQLPTVPPVPASSVDRRISFIRRPLKQTQIRIGMLGLKRHSPDQYAWTVFNELWGGSSSSRLFTVVRTQKGLAYSVGSAYSIPEDRGLIVAISQTRGSQTISAIESILDTSRALRNSSFTLRDLNHAKEGLINQYVQNFTTPAQIVGAFMQHAYFGFPKDYLTTYTDKIRRVSLDDLRRVAKTYLTLDEAAVFLVGDPSTFEKPLSTLGKIQELKPVDYSETR